MDNPTFFTHLVSGTLTECDISSFFSRIVKFMEISPIPSRTSPVSPIITELTTPIISEIKEEDLDLEKSTVIPSSPSCSGSDETGGSYNFSLLAKKSALYKGNPAKSSSVWEMIQNDRWRKDLLDSRYLIRYSSSVYQHLNSYRFISWSGFAYALVHLTVEDLVSSPFVGLVTFLIWANVYKWLSVFISSWFPSSLRVIVPATLFVSACGLSFRSITSKG
jgi:hypothetical protein